MSTRVRVFIVSEFAKAHGGQVRVDSPETDGTMFTVVIPRSD